MKKFILALSSMLIACNIFAFGLHPLRKHILRSDSRLTISSLPGWDGGSDEQGRALSFGYYEFQSASLNEYLGLNSSTHTNFADNYMAVGLDNISNSEGHWLDAIGSFQYVLPQKVTAGTNDSLRLKLHGWHYTMSVLSFDFIASEKVALVVASQIAFGNLKIDRNVGGQKTKYTNPFVAPGLRAELRFMIGQFLIGARATYRYDITHELWKRKDSNMPVMPEYSNDGLAYFGYIGWMFPGSFGQRGGGNSGPGRGTDGGELYLHRE